jgi:hypothetical protein
MRLGAGFPTRFRYAELLARYGRLLLRPEGGRRGASEDATDAAGGERAQARRVLEAEGLRADDFRLGRSKARAPRRAPRLDPRPTPRLREEATGVLGGGGGGDWTWGGREYTVGTRVGTTVGGGGED